MTKTALESRKHVKSSGCYLAVIQAKMRLDIRSAGSVMNNG